MALQALLAYRLPPKRRPVRQQGPFHNALQTREPLYHGELIKALPAWKKSRAYICCLSLAHTTQSSAKAPSSLHSRLLYTAKAMGCRVWLYASLGVLHVLWCRVWRWQEWYMLGQYLVAACVFRDDWSLGALVKNSILRAQYFEVYSFMPHPIKKKPS